MIVALDLTSKSNNCLPSKVASRGAMTKDAPTVRGRKISNPAISKAIVVMPRSISCFVIPGRCCMADRKLLTA